MENKKTQQTKTKHMMEGHPFEIMKNKIEICGLETKRDERV